MLESARSKKIAQYIKTHKGQRVKDQSIAVNFGGRLSRLPVYNIPIEGFLIHNIRNGRFSSELLEREETLKRKLDPTRKQDEKEIRKLLLEINKSETEVLKADLIKNGQLDPGIITFDGAVINANRRMAILRELYEDTRDDKYKYLMVAVLEEGVDEVDLWKIEAGLQFGKDFRLEYGGINELLKLREGFKSGLDTKAISVALGGRYTEKQVAAKLETLKLIDSYLSFINRKGDYHRIREGRDLEKFNSLYSGISALKRSEEKKKLIPDVTAVAFALISHADITHWDIRSLKEIFFDAKAKEELLAPFKKGIPNNGKEITAKEEAITEAFQTAIDIYETRKDDAKPQLLLKKALSALESIKERTLKADQESRSLLQQIQKRATALSNAIRK